MQRMPTGWLAVVCGAAIAAAGSGAPGQAPAPPAGKVKVRPQYLPGRAIRYSLSASGTTAWTPKIQNVEWGRIQTDLTFVLAVKTLRDSGACTFNLLGERLRSAGEGSGGRIDVEGNREKFRVRVKGKWQHSTRKSPLAGAMTMTFGPLGGYRFGTGLAPPVIYMLPHVDHRFWTLLTIAPLKDVGPGDSWNDEFHFPVPGAKDKRLKLTGAWKVAGWRNYRKRKVLAMTLSAKAELKDSDVLLKNGDTIHVTSGTYNASGESMWDVEAGVLCWAHARQDFLVKADKPAALALRSQSRCTLQLLQVRDTPPKKDK